MAQRSSSIILLVLLPVFLFGCGSSEPILEGSPRENLDRAADLIDRGKGSQALEAYRLLARAHAGTEWEEEARIGIARSHRVLKDYTVAIQEYETFLRRYPRSEWVDDAAFEIGLCFADQRKSPALDPGMTEASLNAFERFIAEYPDSPLIEKAREERLKARAVLARKALENGITYRKLRRYSAALFYYRIVLDDFADTEVVPRALYETGWVQAKMGKTDEAQEALGELRERFPDSPWTKKLADNIGHDDGGGDGSP